MKTKSKRNSIQISVICVLALLLILAIALGSSMAWFKDDDSRTGETKLNSGVTITLRDASTDDDVVTFAGKYGGSVFGLPGDDVIGSVGVVPGSTTASVLRAKIITSIKDKDDHEIGDMTEPAGYVTPANDTAYEELTAEGKTYYNVQLLKGQLANASYASGWAVANSGEGWRYYTTVVVLTDKITLFANGVKIPEEVTNAAESWTITVTVEVEAMQAANCPWATDAGTTVTNLADYNGAGRQLRT